LIPLFLDGAGGRIFGLYHPPLQGVPDLGDVIFLPPFGEELNRSRHMIARQARVFGHRGKGVFILDLYGTGDSGGRFEEASWAIWLENIKTVTAWLAARGRPNPDIWAMRTGALLAAAAITQKIVNPAKLILWAPVANGELFITQFLRIRLAAALEAAPDAKETTVSLRNRLAAGEVIEVGGYGLNGDISHALSRERLEKFKPDKALTIHWLEVSGSEPPSLSPAAAKVSRIWQPLGADVITAAVSGPPFWSLPETEWAEGLILATIALTMGVQA
jgi:exosortase A-associated hydrolase 2